MNRPRISARAIIEFDGNVPLSSYCDLASDWLVFSDKGQHSVKAA